MPVIGEGISHRGLTVEDFHYPFYISGTIVAGDVGKAVALDTAAAMTVKLAGAGDRIIGILATYEDRVVEGVKVATVAMKGGFLVTRAAAAAALSVGDTVVGAGAGEVKARRNAGDTANEPDYGANIVTKVTGTAIEILIV